MSQRLFISHASEDAAIADKIVAYLEARGMPCWISSRDIPPRSIYADAIVEGMQSCEACAVLVSAASNASKAVKREVELASHEDKAFIPIRIDRSEPMSGLAYYLRNTQWIEFEREGDGALDRIVANPASGQKNAPWQPYTPTASVASPRQLVIGALVTIAAMALLGIGWIIRSGSPLAETAAKSDLSVSEATVPEATTSDALPTVEVEALRSPPADHNVPPTAARSPTRRFPNGTESEDFCAAVGTVASAFPTAFAEWKRAPSVPLERGQSGESSFRMPGAEICTIIERANTDPAPSYACYWNTQSAVDATRDAQILTESLRSCPSAERGFRGHPRFGEATFSVETLRSEPHVVQLLVWPGSQ